ncbi:SipW-dependent-type signal peptide-containing protein [uncultured Pseudokineococcus sp.]|uniref:SipW-dependent-type signal peptide-containing protein n=1 Tax=uncultured Pseudokineococcus sp. TaxID=1642928 RepID=UPI002615B6A4|nr:SipW-dependent-type signal peptide-containing protein [uncultured Pseudokineococcus sp.]
METIAPAVSATATTDQYHWSSAAPRPRRRRGRVRALLSGGLVLGVGSVATLAAWTDTEFISGNGAGGVDGVAASMFEVQQNVWDGVDGAADFTDRETQDEAGGLVFSPLEATSLSPGDVVYAPMQLRAAPESVGAAVDLAPAVMEVGGDRAFFDALRYSVRSGVSRDACGDAAFDSATQSGVPLVTSSPLGTGTPTTAADDSSTSAFTLEPGPDGQAGEPVDLCFAITLPGGSPDVDSLRGKGATPVWSFTSQSV